MKNAKINKDRPEPTTKEIEKTRDFNFIIKNKKGSQYKILKIAGLIGIAIVGFIASKTYFSPKKVKENSSISQVITKNQITPPIESLTTSFESYSIHSKTGKTITANDGSIINIPKNAFLDNKFKVLNDSVIIKYRSYKTIAEIFLSGIPMTYDSSGNQYHFESAGMFEIKAYDLKGNLLVTNSDALIEVEMSSYDSSEKFNSYYLNNDFTWQYLNSNKAIQKNRTNYSIERRHFQNQQKAKKNKLKIDSIIRANLPKIPAIANKDRYALNLEFDENKFPELKPFKNILFEVLPKNPEFNLEEVKENWNEISLDKIENKYVLILFKNGIKRTIYVKPVVAKENEELTQKIFQQLYESSKEQKTEFYLQQLNKLDSLKEVNKTIVDSISFINQRAEIRAYANSEEVKNQMLVYRTFTIDNFGIYNSDCPTNLPKGTLIDTPIFVNRKDTLHFHKLFIAEYGSNTIYTLYQDSFEKSISFNPTKSTIIWGITDKNKLAVYNFENYMTKLKTSNLPMELNTITSATNIDSIRNNLQWQ